MSAVRISRSRIPPLYTIRDIIKLYRLRAIKDLSQNFLLESRVTDKIVKAAGYIAGGEVCEVGPGPGSITRSILNRNPSNLLLIEKDRRFKVPLEMLQEAAPCPVNIIFGDVLSFNMERLFSEQNARTWCENTPPIHIIGNLPFNVSTPLIIKWLRAISEKNNAWKYGRVPLTLTFQKEVAERMAADVLSPQRSRLSVMTQNWCYVTHKFTIPGKAFVPKPDVDVGVVHLVPLVTPQIDAPFNIVEKVVRCVFHYRQKYCIRGIELLFPKSSRENFSEEMCSLAVINPMARPIELTVQEFGKLCIAYMDILERHPSLIYYNRNKIEIDEDDKKEEDIDDGTSSDSTDDLRSSDHVLSDSGEVTRLK